MRLRLRVFVALCTCSSSLAKRDHVETAFSESSPGEQSWISHAETHDNEALQVRDTFTEANTVFHKSSIPSLELLPLHGGASESGVTERAAEESRQRRIAKGGKGLHFAEGLKASLSLILFAGFLVVCLKKLSPLRAEVLGMFGDRRAAEIRARLGKIKELLPAAERLASAVGSDEALRLLRIAQAVVNDEHVAAPGMNDDDKTLESSCAIALEALRTLHQAGTEQVKEVVHSDKCLPEFSPGISWYEGAVAENAESDRRIQLPLRKTYQSLREYAEMLSQRFDKEADRASSGPPFTDERDGAVLLATATALESLRATSESRRRLAGMAKGLSKTAALSAKLFILEQLDASNMHIEWGADFLGLYMGMSRDATEAQQDLPAAGLPPKEENSVFFSRVEAGLLEVTSLLEQLQACAEAVRTSATLEAANAAAAEAAGIKHKAYKRLKDVCALTHLRPAFPKRFDDKARAMIMHMARKYMRTILLGDLVLSNILQDVQATVAQVNQGACGERRIMLNAALFKIELDEAEKILWREGNRFHDAVSLMEMLKEGDDGEVVADGVQKLNSIVRALATDKAAAQLGKLKSRFLAVLESDMNHTTAEIERAALQSSELSGFEWQKYVELQRRFQAALKAAETAPTLLEAASIAADMRSHAASIQKLLLGVGGEEAPPRS